MSTVNPSTHDQSGTFTRTPPPPVPESRDGRVMEVHRSETKPSLMTTEFWAMAIGIAALIVIYLVADNPSLDLWRTCLLATIGASAYIVSRGIAKSGAARERWEEHRR
jgi:hypothetical protein